MHALSPGESFKLVERRDGDTVVLTLLGELDIGTVAEVQQRLDALRDARQATLLELDELSFMDSTGIRLLLGAREDTMRVSWSFHVTRGSAPVRRVLEAAQVIDHLPYVDRAEA
jgi:anti-sigma B factor antagonist